MPLVQLRMLKITQWRERDFQLDVSLIDRCEILLPTDLYTLFLYNSLPYK